MARICELTGKRPLSAKIINTIEESKTCCNSINSKIQQKTNSVKQ